MRVSVYRWLAALTAIVTLPLVVWVLNTIWVRLYYLFGLDLVFSEGTLIHSFYLAVGSLLGLVFVAGFYARSYHKGRKPDFDIAWAVEKRKLTPIEESPAPVTGKEAS